MNETLENLTYREKQKLFKDLYKHRGKLIWSSREKTIGGTYVGRTYVKKDKLVKELEQDENNIEVLATVNLPENDK